MCLYYQQQQMMKQWGQMKMMNPKTKLLHSEVKLIFLNPYHYTYVLQKQDNYIYLYDQLTSSMVGKSKFPLSQNFKMLAFTDNFNIFCSYVESKSIQSHAQIIVFNLQLDGTISHHRYPLTRNKISENLFLFSIAYLQKQQMIVGLGRNKIYFISNKGQVMKDVQIKNNVRDINLINGFPIRQNKWILIQENVIYFVTVSLETFTIDDTIHLHSKITSMFLDASIRCQFMGFITELHNIIILVKIQEKWYVCHRFQIPNLFLRKLCFIYPGVNTSTVNKFKDKIFLLIYGQKNEAYDCNGIDIRQYQIPQAEILPKFPIPEQFAPDRMIYFHEYSINELRNHQNSSKIKPHNMFCMRDIGVIKYSIWANEHQENHVRVFLEDKTIHTIDLTTLLPGQSIGEQWVNLGYKFQARNSNVLYEQTEDNFQKQKIEYKTISEQQLNDWSYSLFSKEVLMRKSIKRINCINFD